VNIIISNYTIYIKSNLSYIKIFLASRNVSSTRLRIPPGIFYDTKISSLSTVDSSEGEKDHEREIRRTKRAMLSKKKGEERERERERQREGRQRRRGTVRRDGNEREREREKERK